MGSGTPSWEEWLPLVAPSRDGDRAAQQRLFELFQPGLYHYMLRLSRDPNRAADLTQEAFVRAFLSLSTLREDRALRGWLYRLARNLFRDAYARKTEVHGQEATLLATADEAPGPAAQLEQTELRAAVLRAVDNLPRAQREVIELYHLQGLDLAETAQALGLREGTVKSRLARGRATLRRHLTPFVENG
ncbi:MAG TPA: hypothetical protein DCZ72_11890 [Armatimonadetes bacterium]|nr:hypothetical protein [Armatimonadota bacterium]